MVDEYFELFYWKDLKGSVSVTSFACMKCLSIVDTWC